MIYAWEQRRLGEVTTKIGSGKTPKGGSAVYLRQGIPLLRSQNITSDAVDFSDVVYISNEMDTEMGNSRVQTNDVLLNITGASIGRSAVYKQMNMANVNQHVCIVRPTNDINADFIQLNLTSPNGQQQIGNNQAGGGREGLNFQQIAKIAFHFPTLLEQSHIGTFFRTLDNTIAIHKRKLDGLRELKKAYLQVMFPQAEEVVPRVRFAGFTEPWKSKKLGELGNIVRGSSPRPIQDPIWFDNQSDVGWLRISDVTAQNGRIHYLEQKISEAGQAKTRVLTEPHLLLSIAATVGKPVVNYVKTGVHDGFLIFLSPQFEQEFMFQWLEMFRPQWQQYGQPGSQVNLNSDLVKAQEIYLPSCEEQISIGNFFVTLDEQITIYSAKIEQLTRLKSAYLQKMFV